MGNTKTEPPRIVPAKPTAEMAEHDDVTTCGICSEPFKNGEVAVQAARCRPDIELPTNFTPEIIEKLDKAQRVAEVREKFWAHPVCLFSLAREAEGSASRVAAMPPEPPDARDEALLEKRKPK
jgi:hypothetical protein